MLDTSKLMRLGTNHKIGITITIRVIVLSQLEEEVNEDAGSNTENKFVIIFISY